MPGGAASCRITTPNTPSSCYPPAAKPNLHKGNNGAGRVALPVAAAASGRTRPNCARTGADPVVVPWSIPRRTGCVETIAGPLATAPMARDARFAQEVAPPRLRPPANSRPAPPCQRQASFQTQMHRRTGSPLVARRRRPGPRPRSHRLIKPGAWCESGRATLLRLEEL